MNKALGLIAIIILMTMMVFAKDNKPNVAKSTKPIIIDVRTEQEFNAGNIKGSILIPYDVITKKITEIAPDKNSKIILYCRSGRRSGIAESSLKELGYKNVENYGSMQSAIEKLGIK